VRDIKEKVVRHLKRRYLKVGIHFMGFVARKRDVAAGFAPVRFAMGAAAPIAPEFFCFANFFEPEVRKGL
jgi:hypothetical protein